MARHEFGILDHTPSENENFQEYEPGKYGCISIDDRYLEDLMPTFRHIPTFFHSLTRKETGLNYIGITLIPPQSCGSFSEALRERKNHAYDELCALLDFAKKENRFVIHYGL